MVAASPQVEEIRLEPVSVTKGEVWLRLKDKILVLKKRKKSEYILHIFSNAKVISSYSFNPTCNGIVIENVDVCQAINNVVSNWDIFIEQYELEQRARALEVLGNVVPSLPSEWEQLVSNISKVVLEGKIVRTFYVREGNKEVVLGMYCYEDGYYRNCEETLEKEIEELAGRSTLLDAKVVPSLRGNIVKKIEGKTLAPYEPVKGCLLFRTKIFCWEPFLNTKDLEKVLTDSSPDIVVMHRIPWNIRPELYKHVRPDLLKYMPPKTTQDLIELFKGLAPKSFKAFLDWVKHPSEREEDVYPRIALLLEIIGYTLYPHGYPFNKAVLLVGEGSNGKTTYIRLIEKVLGKENIASVRLTDLDPNNNRFAAYDLWGKLANISSETNKGLLDPTLFKMLSGEDPIRFERKHRDAFVDRNYAKMIFSANELPRVTEDTHAFWRRWIVIEFPNRFKPDPEFFGRTFTDEEVEGIIVCALHAFRLVMERGGFTEQGIRDPQEGWQARSNPAYRVIKRMLEDGVIEFDVDGYVVKSDLYQLYKKYVDIINTEEGERVRSVEQKDFTRCLTNLFHVWSGDKRIGNKIKHVYFGVRIKDYGKVKELLEGLETPPSDLTQYMTGDNDG